MGEGNAGNKRPEALPLGPLPGRRQSTERAPVEAAFECDDPRPTGRLPRDLERRLVGLGAGVAEERLPTREAFLE